MNHDPLHKLIVSLSQNEKTYFKKAARSFKGGTQFLDLFDAILAQKEYNEPELKKAFDHKHFAQYKKHLFDKLLSALRAYHSSHSVEAKINSNIQNFEILRTKGMNVAAKKALMKAKKLAEKNYRLADIIKIRKYEGDLIKTSDDINILDQHLDTYQETSQWTNNQIQKQIELEKSYVSIVKWNKQMEWARSKEDRAYLRNILKETSFINEPQLNPETEIKRLYINGMYSYFIGDFTSSYAAFNQQLNTYIENEYLQEDTLSFLQSMGNNILLSLFTNSNSFEGYWNSFQSYQKNKKITLKYADILSIILKLIHLVKKGSYHESVEWIEQHNLVIIEFQNTVTRDNKFYNEFSILTFYMIAAQLGNNSPRKALVILNSFINNADKKLKKDSYILARIVNLIVHLELENYDLIEYELISAKQLLKQQGNNFLTEKTIIQFVESYLNWNSTKEKVKGIKELQNKLTQHKASDQENMVFQLFDFVDWTNHMELVLTS